MHDRLHLLRLWVGSELGIADVTLTPASEDASFRRYFRVHDGDRSWVVMDAPPELEDCRPFLHVARLLDAAGVNVPAVVAADLDQGLLLLTDLGNERYLDRLDAACADGLYADAMGALVRMQALASTDGLPAYDAQRLQAEMALFPDWLLARHLGRPADERERKVLAQAFARLVQAAMAQPQVFVHRDYHSRNLMVRPERNPGVIDFQDAVRGPWTYDLVSLLRDAYVRWPEERVRGWALEFHRQVLEQGLGATGDPDSFLRSFDLMGIQRHLKVAGIFARLHHRDGKRGYLDDIPLVIDYLVAACGRHSEFEALRELCERRDLANALRAASARSVGDSSSGNGA